MNGEREREKLSIRIFLITLPSWILDGRVRLLGSMIIASSLPEGINQSYGISSKLDRERERVKFVR